MATISLSPQQLYRESDLSSLSSKSTKDIPPIEEILGQERAHSAVEFAMSIKEKGYNIYAVGRNG
ncbi:ATP-dependent protease La type II [Vibrio ishigakensis]|nr:ATP-dependent protease La type II [Vibrio ishigakensis]GAM63167.1 ATP-dependent protease La type II [Vibrio ishigakensis]GAM68116.1 ATP-dependent protease La type II [Vibrio sp. JCM 19236]